MTTLPCSILLEKYRLPRNTNFTSSTPQFKIISCLTTTDDRKCNQTPVIVPNIKPSILSPRKVPPLLKIPKKNDGAINQQDSGRKVQSFLTTVFRLMDDLVANFIDPPLPPSIDPNHVLSGNFAPVGELHPTPSCPVIEGILPASLNGAYIRNGPNPQFVPRGPYHLFDGDGMLHLITIADGKATFCSRFVKTYKYELERDAGSPVILNLFSAFTGFLPFLARCAIAAARAAAGQYDRRRGMGVANTSLALIGGRLFALGESDLPYEVELTPTGDVATLGRHEAFGESFMTMTAHPKVDAGTGETFAYRNGIKPPFLTYFRIGADGVKGPDVPISSLTQASMVHDFAVSENYAIFPDLQIVISPAEILRGLPPLRVDPAKVPRLGIIPRHAADDRDMWWIDVPEFNMVHAVNAWEEGTGIGPADTVVMVATNVLMVEHVLDRLDLARSSMERIEIDLSRKRIIGRRPVSNLNVDFGVINPAYVGKKNRYVYAAIGDPMPKIKGVVKIDLSLSESDTPGECAVATRLYGEGCYGGEPYFVAREPGNPAAEEDDGYLVSYVHNEKSEESNFVVMDAKSPSLEIMAVVKLPRRVPYGFHGIFVPNPHYNKQL